MHRQCVRSQQGPPTGPPPKGVNTSGSARFHNEKRVKFLSWRMIPRGFYGCSRCRSSLHAKWQAHRSKTIRSYATSSATTASPVAQSPAAILGTLTTELDKISPRFELQPSQIRILKSPVDFYEALKVGSSLRVPSENVHIVHIILVSNLVAERTDMSGNV